MHERATSAYNIPNSPPFSTTIDDFTGMGEMMMDEGPGSNCSAVCADKPPRGIKRRMGEINGEIPEEEASARKQADMKEFEMPVVQELIQEKVPEGITDALTTVAIVRSSTWMPAVTAFPKAWTSLDGTTGSELPAAAANLAPIVGTQSPRTAM